MQPNHTIKGQKFLKQNPNKKYINREKSMHQLKERTKIRQFLYKNFWKGNLVNISTIFN